MHPSILALAEGPLSMDTGVSVVLALAIGGAAFAVKQWIRDEKDARVEGDHDLELRVAALEARRRDDSAAQSQAHMGGG